ncbi:MAG TPA: helix-turn-helix domain-containing protein [Xanthobacteraceae bacterium]|nr:helix-turn-helix domain-containing protein [Xanthobacteraceae bacterium]
MSIRTSLLSAATQNRTRATTEGRAVSQVQPARQPLFNSVELTGASVPYARGEEIYGEGEAAEYIYKVISGSVRSYKVLNDGRRQICAFHLPGDVFGLEAGEQHAFSAEAICQSVVLLIKRSTVAAVAAKDTMVARQLWNITVAELQKMQDHVMLLAKNAQERVVSFLLQMAQRAPGTTEIELPMTRQDIADYLGLTIETISRTLTQLETQATIALPSSRRVLLRNRGMLDRLNA